jgi:hypothetical protein
MKNSPFLSCGGWNKGDGQGLGFRPAAQLLRRSPIGAAPVERIQDNVTAGRIVKAFHILSRRVINDGRITPAAYLPEHLKHERGFTGSRVADDLHVLSLGAGRDTQHFAHPIDLEADAVPLDDTVELAWSEHLRAFQPTPIAKLFLPLHIFQDRKRQQDQKDQGAADQRWPEECGQAGSTIDNILHVVAQPGIGEAAQRTTKKERVSMQRSIC